MYPHSNRFSFFSLDGLEDLLRWPDLRWMVLLMLKRTGISKKLIVQKIAKGPEKNTLSRGLLYGAVSWEKSTSSDKLC